MEGLTNDNWQPVPMYDNGQNGDDVANDHVWTVVISNISQAIMNGVFQKAVWVVDGGNLLFNLEQDMMTLHGHTDYTIQVPSGEPVTKTVLFTVDMTEWLDQDENGGWVCLVVVGVMKYKCGVILTIGVVVPSAQ